MCLVVKDCCWPGNSSGCRPVTLSGLGLCCACFLLFPPSLFLIRHLPEDMVFLALNNISAVSLSKFYRPTEMQKKSRLYTKFWCSSSGVLEILWVDSGFVHLAGGACFAVPVQHDGGHVVKNRRNWC